jgi:glutamate synthase domain-containing protein 2
MKRRLVYFIVLLVAALTGWRALADSRWLWGFAPALVLALLGAWDLMQRSHSLMRNYPLIARFRWVFEAIRPQLQQYLLVDDLHGVPFNREQRSMVYARAKGENDFEPFGTESDVGASRFEWLNHSITPAEKQAPERVRVGSSQCAQPYNASLLNISAMSFGALGARAIAALNLGAKAGGFAHDTGEGGISAHHRQGGDLIWELGSGYFGCRDKTGKFDAERFREQASGEQVRMVELKLSQGAKAGHGGILPGAKVSAEIAAARGVQPGEDCVSPPRHSEFATPLEMLEFLARLRELSGGKPVGFKLCIGHRWEFLAICKAMLATGITPDFIVVDGKEGGTGAAPEEFSDSVGTPLREGLIFVRNVLVGLELKSQIRLAASGKIVSGFDIFRNLALGADWCNAARPFMFALGCVQSRRCHTDTCPTGVATQNLSRQRGLVVADKAPRVERFHAATIDRLMDLLAAAGLETAAALTPEHVCRRIGPGRTATLGEFYGFLEPGELRSGARDPWYRRQWALARAESFAPQP